MSGRQAVSIDYCPTCRGVWLDRGELDKIIELSVPRQKRPQPTMREQGIPSYYDDHPHDHHDKGHKRRKSWLHEIRD
jgi:Zn-finger nucleic acid-binding protein